MFLIFLLKVIANGFWIFGKACRSTSPSSRNQVDSSPPASSYSCLPKSSRPSPFKSRVDRDGKNTSPLCLCVGVLEPRTENATLAAQVIFWRENDLGSNDPVWPRPKWHSEMLKTRSEITRAMQHWHPTHNWKTNSVGEKPKWAGRLHADTLNHEK